VIPVLALLALSSTPPAPGGGPVGSGPCPHCQQLMSVGKVAVPRIVDDPSYKAKPARGADFHASNLRVVVQAPGVDVRVNPPPTVFGGDIYSPRPAVVAVPPVLVPPVRVAPTQAVIGPRMFWWPGQMLFWGRYRVYHVPIQ
jgi:hypothetical protein